MNHPSVPAAVLFDLDGTLLDTPSAIADCLRTTLARSGRRATDEELRATIGRPLNAVFAQLTGLPEEDPEVAEHVAGFRRAFREEAVPRARDLIFPGVPELLDRLADHGAQLAIVTSKILPSAEELLHPAGLRSRFDTLICHGMAPRGKPHPDLALLAAECLGRRPEECVVVGDAVDDARMARAAGMTSLGVTWGVGRAEELTGAGAHSVVTDVPALAAALDAFLSTRDAALSLPT
ncbi:HAD family hydrolase (plasmid) [Streptomyces sp. BI20]|uniref:HAD family hydrolase n=1 Tax=Streptomyces sp. BI20 TaxID=3403460 RepID=UPI003C788A1C